VELVKVADSGGGEGAAVSFRFSRGRSTLEYLKMGTE
jgi:hypothetical protein